MALTLEPKLFTTEAPKNYSGARGGLANFLKPKSGTGYIDVINDYAWTSTRLSYEARQEVPDIVLTEWRILRSSLESSALYYAEGTGQQITPTGNSTGSENPMASDSYVAGYKGLLDFANSSNFSYRLPFFSDINTDINNSWTSLDILEKAKNAADFIVPGLGGIAETATAAIRLGYEAKYPRVGIMDRPKLWESSTPRSITIKFPLFNTLEEDDIQKNWELCYLLTYQNLFNKRDFITAIPPVFYTVYAPGQYFSIGAYVSDLKIYNRGHIHRIPFGNKVRNIPDAFEIEMTLTDMIMPSQNMHSVLYGETPVNVKLINAPTPTTPAPGGP